MAKSANKQIEIKSLAFCQLGRCPYFCAGEMAEWSIAAVLKTVEGNTSGGSNPSLSAKNPDNLSVIRVFLCYQQHFPRRDLHLLQFNPFLIPPYCFLFLEKTTSACSPFVAIPDLL